MTICLKNSAECAKFFARCMYEKTCCRDLAHANFSSVSILTCFDQVNVETSMTKNDVENLLENNKIKYLWVNEY